MLFEEEERRNCNLIIRIRERVKKRFQALYYLLKAEGYIEKQDELIEAIVEIWERYPEILKKVLKRKFI